MTATDPKQTVTQIEFWSEMMFKICGLICISLVIAPAVASELPMVADCDKPVYSLDQYEDEKDLMLELAVKAYKECLLHVLHGHQQSELGSGDEITRAEQSLRKADSDLQSVWARAENGDEADLTKQAIRDELHAIRARHTLSWYELSSILGDTVIDGRKIDKGGSGIVRDDIYIFADGERNILSLNGKIWKGKKSHIREIVFLNNDGTQSTERNFDANTGIVIFFSPAEIRFIDFYTNTGGRYLR